jgi:hypothetical protein
LTGTESIKEATKYGRSLTVRDTANVSKLGEIIEGDDRYCQSCCHIAITNLEHFILESILKVRKISAKWIPHDLDTAYILTGDQLKDGASKCMIN